MTNVNIRTDLATEAKDMYVESTNQSIEGLVEKEEEYSGIKVNTITLDTDASKQIGKKQGNYITIYTDNLSNQEDKETKKLITIIQKQLDYLLKEHDVQPKAKGLIVGLGNDNITPDALGPATINRIVVTNHLFTLDDKSQTKGFRPVAAISPGVMGVTGLETSDIVTSVIQSYKPDFLIVIDALASRSIERVNETIQITDTGIHPGSGVGNYRKEISKETVGIPVLAIGVPTVVDAVSIVSDTFEYIERYFSKEWKEKDRLKKKLIPSDMQGKHTQLGQEEQLDKKQKQTFLGLVGTLSDDEKRQLLSDVLLPMGKNMIVTPKEVDHFIENMASILAKGINRAIHEREIEIN